MSTVLGASPGERLRTLRELLGLTGAALSDICGMSKSWISQVETGARDATEEGLRAVADGTGTPMSFFYARPSTIPRDSLHFRKLASASRTVTKRVQAFYGESYRVSEDILQDARYPVPPLPYATADELKPEDIEELADATRKVLRLAPDKPIPNLTRAMERTGIAVAPIVLTDPVSEERSATQNHFGLSYWGGIGETALITYFPGAQGDRDRFTLAHELAHLILHTFRPHATDPETEANRFAGALLVPRERAVAEITDRLSLTGYARLKATWGVSIQALIMRGYAIGNLSDSRKRSLYVQLTQRGWRKNEPVTVGQETPLLLGTLLTRQFGAKPYINAAEHLAIHPTVLRSIAPLPQDLRPRTGTTSASEGEVVQFRRPPQRQQGEPDTGSDLLAQ
ncbi:ImmA/IrrE family metallo-endopeptidase [Streptomyces sp. 5-10]|uniref:helix-turn-helix domain-containing protein n=1 Tax=Streptomyces sp. 5-10 TaxID=878925 RepID=UPI001CC2BD20|nr:XRE family transcriptional regulator [Streptomyces sp. 5-10]